MSNGDKILFARPFVTAMVLGTLLVVFLNPRFGVAEKVDFFQICKMEKELFPLRRAIRERSIEKIKCLIENSYPINSVKGPEERGQTALGLATSLFAGKDSTIINYLIKNGADVNLGNPNALAIVFHTALNPISFDDDDDLVERSPAEISKDFPLYFNVIKKFLQSRANLESNGISGQYSNLFEFTEIICSSKISEFIDYNKYLKLLAEYSVFDVTFQQFDKVKNLTVLVPFGYYDKNCLTNGTENIWQKK